MLSTDEGVAVGTFGKILNWNGTDWSAVPSSPTAFRLRSVSMTGTSDGWAVGDYGEIIQYTGIEWIPEFQSLSLLPLFITATLIAIITIRRKQ